MLDLDYTITAAERHLAAWRQTLADAALAVELHRDHLKSPQAQYAPFEAEASKALGTVKWLEARLATLRMPAVRVAALTAQITALQAELARVQAETQDG